MSASPARVESVAVPLGPDEVLYVAPFLAGTDVDDFAVPDPWRLPLRRLFRRVYRVEKFVAGASGRTVELHAHRPHLRFHRLELAAGERVAVPMRCLVGWTASVRLRSSWRLIPLGSLLLGAGVLPVATGSGQLLLYAPHGFDERRVLDGVLLPLDGVVEDGSGEPTIAMARVVAWGQGVRLRPELLPSKGRVKGVFRLLWSALRVVPEGSGRLVIAARHGDGSDPGERGVLGVLMDSVSRVARSLLGGG